MFACLLAYLLVSLLVRLFARFLVLQYVHIWCSRHPTCQCRILKSNCDFLLVITLLLASGWGDTVEGRNPYNVINCQPQLGAGFLPSTASQVYALQFAHGHQTLPLRASKGSAKEILVEDSPTKAPAIRICNGKSYGWSWPFGIQAAVGSWGFQRYYMFEWNNHSRQKLPVLLLNHLMMCGLNIRTGNSGETYFENK